MAARLAQMALKRIHRPESVCHTLLLPLRDADADDRPPGGSARRPVVATANRRGRGAGDHALLRLGGGPAVPRRPLDAGQAAAPARLVRVAAARVRTARQGMP